MDPVKRPAHQAAAMDRAVLDAFVDGALSPEEAARVVLHLADCPGDQAYVDVLMETNALLAAAYADPLDEPLPERLRAAIFPPRAEARIPRWRGARPGRAGAIGAMALAACVALLVGLGIAPPRGGPGGGDAGSPAFLAALLEAEPSGSVAAAPDGAEATLIATFLDARGRPCREYEILDLGADKHTEGVACREAFGVWTSEIAVASRLAGPAASEGFVPAAGAGDGALDSALDRLGAGMALTPEEEADLLARRWAN